MKRNGEFVGVDEKFIPENEKYVDESLLGDKEKSKKVAKRVGKAYLCFLGILVIFSISMPIFIYTQARKEMDNRYSNLEIKNNKYTFYHLQGAIWGSELRDALDKIITNNKLDGYTAIEVVYNEKSAITADEILSIKNEISDTNSDDYEVSLDYADSFGQVVNRVTIKDI